MKRNVVIRRGKIFHPTHGYSHLAKPLSPTKTLVLYRRFKSVALMDTSPISLSPHHD